MYTQPHKTPAPQIIIFTKTPYGGKAKTRLQTAYTRDNVNKLAAAALEDTVRTAKKVAPVVIVLEGRVEDLPVNLRKEKIVEQCTGTFEERLENAFLKTGGGVLIGMDTPQITVQQLEEALQAYNNFQIPFGLTHDGGWWILGLPSQKAHLVRNVKSSTNLTGEKQLEELVDGNQVYLLETLTDVDTYEDVLSVAKQYSNLIFSKTYARTPLRNIL